MSVTALGAIPVIVASRQQDDVEAISRTLRNAGMAAHCRWISQSKDLAAAFQECEADLLMIFTDDSLPLDLILKIRDSRAAGVSVVVVQDDAAEEAIGEALQAGAQDLVSFASTARLQAVAQREILSSRRVRELKRAELSADKVRDALENMVAESPDSMLHVQEGIVVSVNPAWLELFGYANDEGLIGTPVMDLFDAESQTAIKGALVACAEGKWTDHTLKSRVLSSDGSTLTVEASLEAAVLDDEPAIRIEMRSATDRAEELEERVSHVTERHPMTGFFRRQRFLESLRERLAEESRGGVVVLAYVKPDNFTAVRDKVGPIESDDLLLQFARILEEIAKPADVYGQFGGDMFMVLLARGAMRDAEAWAENLRARTARSLFEAAGKSLAVTCTIGLAQYDEASDDLSALVIAAQKANLEGRKCGGDRVVVQQREQSSDDETDADQVSLQAIKQALMTGSFSLVFQPVASLQGKSQRMFDVLVRMLDENNREVLPAHFLQVAAKNGLMKNIDRWVIDNAITFCADQNPTHLFIRLSNDSLPDTTLASWLAQQIAARGIDANRLVFQVTERNVEAHIKETKTLAAQLKALKCRFAIEHFGLVARPLQVIEHVNMDFLKIDGSLMEGLAGDREMQERIRNYITSAKERGIETIAERVEDANTMAVLWQLGVEFIQGYYVQGPEEVVLETARHQARNKEH